MKKEVIAVGIVGAGGRMGSEVRDLIAQDERFVINGLLEDPLSPLIGQHITTPAQQVIPYCSDPQEAFKDTQVIIDFSLPKGTLSILPYARNLCKPLVIGTTGFSQEQLQLITKTATSIPIVQASNMSLGVNLLQALVEVLVNHLPQGFDLELIERHHRHKLDSPSGTARELATLIRKTQGRDQEPYFTCGRPQGNSVRESDDLVIHALRGGGIIGEHQLQAIGEAEELILMHRAFNRKVFAKGALAATLFVRMVAPGLYSMRDVLGFA